MSELEGLILVTLADHLFNDTYRECDCGHGDGWPKYTPFIHACHVSGLLAAQLELAKYTKIGVTIDE